MIKDQILSFNTTLDSVLFWDDSGAALITISICCVLFYIKGGMKVKPSSFFSEIVNNNYNEI